MNKKTQNINNFCIHGNETNWPSEILQNTPVSMQIILLMHTDVGITYTHFSKSTSYEQNPKNENNNVI